MTEQRRVSDRLEKLMKEVRRERAAGDVGLRPLQPGSDRIGAPNVAGDRSLFGRWVRRGLLAVTALILPFFVLLRSATWLYGGWLGTWTALAVGAVLTFGVLAGYTLVVARWVRKRVGRRDRGNVTKRLIQATAVVVAAWCGYGLVFLSGANAKSDAVRAEYRSLHPHLRLAVATLVLVDSDLLVTDAARDLDDYAAMGLPANERSLHLRQADGYVHALDLRTAGRPWWVNGLVRAWFSGTGFRTLRHVGTADHLHVSLPTPLQPPRRRTR